MFPLIVYSIAVSVAAVLFYYAAFVNARRRDDAEDRNRDLDATVDHLRYYVDRLEAERRHEVEDLRAACDLWRTRAESLLQDASAVLTRHYDTWPPVDTAAQDEAA